MADMVVLTNKDIDPDIYVMLEEAAARSTPEYQMGYTEGRMQAISDIMAGMIADIKNMMIGPAETFYRDLLGIISQEGILQHRIGVDQASGTPTTLTVISHTHADKIPEIMDMAAALELRLSKDGCDCSFWVISDDHLEQSLVDHDFPCYRRSV